MQTSDFALSSPGQGSVIRRYAIRRYVIRLYVIRRYVIRRYVICRYVIRVSASCFNVFNKKISNSMLPTVSGIK